MLNRKKIIAFITILLISSTTFLAYPRELDPVIPEAEAQALPSPDLDNLLWNQTYGGTDGDVGSSVQVTSDGGYIIAGYTESFGTGEVDVYLVKIQPLISQPITTTTSTTTQIDQFTFPSGVIIIAVVIAVAGIAIALVLRSRAPKTPNKQ